MFGFSVRKGNNTLGNMAPDSELVFEIGGFFFGRGRVTRATMTENGIISYWSPFDGIDVTTELIIFQNGYSLRHTINSNIECTAYSCGFAISQDGPDYRQGIADDCANAFSGRYGCEVSGGPGLIINASPNTNLLYPRTAIPAVKHTISVGTNRFNVGVMLFI